MKRSKATTVSFKTHSFEECLRLDPDLTETRAEYATMAARERRQAAEWAYGSEALERARKAAAERGAILQGDSPQGTFAAAGVSGVYGVAGQRAVIKVTRRCLR